MLRPKTEFGADRSGCVGPESQVTARVMPTILAEEILATLMGAGTGLPRPRREPNENPIMEAAELPEAPLTERELSAETASAETDGPQAAQILVE